MSNLRQSVADYLTMRRALGYKLDKTERLLGQFTAAGAAAIWTSRRLAEVRLFARHLRALTG
ncbi:hypothetical protein [Pseudorhodobacter aquimaris]|uniref:hypothetical protein n=1 Tax=Pseudorhodobacter aquimaris TaxID=687412 RepID=UPI000AC1F179|nr:hypothetical protein [Pseudorhodobacter aquimaris]